MSDEERELRRRLAPGPPPRPPEGLLEKLKSEIPERLPSNVRPFRPRLPATLLRIAAALFVVGGAVLVVTRAHREVPAPPAAEVAHLEEFAPRVAEPAAPAPEAKAAEEERRPPEKRKEAARDKDAEQGAGFSSKLDRADAPRAQAPAAANDFAPAMPDKGLPDERRAKQSAPALAGAPAPQRSRDEQDAIAPEPAPSREAEAAREAPPPAALGAMEKKKTESASRAMQEGASGGARPAEKPAAASPRAAPAFHGYSPQSGLDGAASRAVSPTAGSLLARVLGRSGPAAAARDGERVLVLLSLPRGSAAQLSGETPLTVLSAAALADGGIVVLAETRGEVRGATLRSGDSVSSVASIAPSLATAGLDLRLAELAWRLERARASGDDEARAAVAREAAALSRLDARASVLERLAVR